MRHIGWIRSLVVLICFCCCVTFFAAADNQMLTVPFNGGTLQLTPLCDNAVRIRFVKKINRELPEWIYVEKSLKNTDYKYTDKGEHIVVEMKKMIVCIDKKENLLSVRNTEGNSVFTATAHELEATTIQSDSTYVAELVFDSAEDEYLFGLGQFQDGFLNVRGLSRRLTQVNTQIAIPFLLSNKGYGVLWNNYGMTEFNPANEKVVLKKQKEHGEQVVVNVTSTEGSKKEIREDNLFGATITIPSDGKYALLLDVGQKMARRHHLSIDGVNQIDIRNLWLPPTTSTIVELKVGTHVLTAQLEREDHPVVYYKKVDDRTVLRSPVAESVDYTVFVGNADEIIASYRTLTGETPMMPCWALGYIHCRERFHSQKELVETAKQFRQKQLPIDVMVQDWQYWGKYGWNAMRFDETNYPNPTEMMRQLKEMNLHLMLSVWSKVDPISEVGKMMQEKGYYIPQTTWVDFFYPEAAAFYWENFSERLLKSYRIDAWWQDATEPENDDLEGRRVMNGQYPGEIFRNVYPLLVNKTVYEGCRNDDQLRRTMILTRSGFPGIQRYGAALWSGDVGNDWETLRRQLSAGLGLMASGLPWWTYDAGGFFRPGNQYSDADYIERMIRWIQAGTFLPLMRVHGYMSDTEPWRYGAEAERIIADYLRLRYRLLPYIYSAAADVAFNGSTMMRPLLFDFAQDEEALKQSGEYMFGKALLIHPVTEKGVTVWRTYLPKHEEGWSDFWTGKKYKGGQYVSLPVSLEKIPVFVKNGSILPMGPNKQYVLENTEKPIDIDVYPGADASFSLYEDEGDNYNYEKGAYSVIPFHWNEKKNTLTIEKRQGSFDGMELERTFHVVMNGVEKTVTYKGRKTQIKF